MFKSKKYSNLFTRTTNGELAYSEEHYQQTPEHALVGFTYGVTKKDDFESVTKYLDIILDKGTLQHKVYALIAIVYFRDIDFGKGLRNPFISGLMYLCQYQGANNDKYR